jgi:peptidyl-prolyl cis-trans isomerase B (cyclophilin B)
VPTATIVQPTIVPAVCEGEGIGDIERTGERRFSAYPEMVIDPTKTYVAEMQTTKGLIIIELTAAQTPITVNSFVFLSCTGYFDGLTFHRVTREPTLAIIQGGDPRGNGTGGPGYTFEDEFDDSLTHEAGVISMANAGAGTNGSQFFITVEAAAHLDGRHSVFGHLTAGQDVVPKIVAGDTILAVSIRETS